MLFNQAMIPFDLFCGLQMIRLSEYVKPVGLQSKRAEEEESSLANFFVKHVKNILALHINNRYIFSFAGLTERD